jgi:hypothetical protein
MDKFTGKGMDMLNRFVNRVLDNEWAVMIGSGVIMSALVIQFIIVSTN